MEEETNNPFVFKEFNDIEKEFSEYKENNENFMLVLFNDPFNKRIYVATCLMQIMSFTEETAADVMMQAHTNGLAIVGEYSKEVANDYCKKLNDKGLMAEVMQKNGGDEAEGGGGDGAGAAA